MERGKEKTAGAAFIKALQNVIPVAQDPAREWVRKVAFLTAFIVFIGAGWYLLDDMWVQPQQTQTVIGNLRDWYYAEDGGSASFPEQGGTPVQFPVGMLPQYQALYRGNQEVRGWIRFTAGEGEEDVFEGTIDNPIVQTTDNDYYLNRDFWGREDKAGTLYFDYRNDLSDGGLNRNLIVYGHNLKSGLMFSKFNLLVSGKVERAKKLTTLSLNTLYEQRNYKVFAVIVLDAGEEADFSVLRTQFGGESDFLRFVQQLRDRSLYHFGDVDVTEGDELLTMLTCSNKRDTTLTEGRTVIVARRVRNGEDLMVDPQKTTLNENVLMPKQWYRNKKLPLPEAYSTEGTSAVTTATTLMTIQSAVVTSTSLEETASTLDTTETTTEATDVTETTTTTVETTVTSTETTTTTVTTAETTVAPTTTTTEETTTSTTVATTTTVADTTTATVTEPTV